MKILNYNTEVKYKSKHHGIIEGYIYYLDKMPNGEWVYYVDVDYEKNNISIKDVDDFCTNEEFIIELKDIVSEIKDSDWIDESEA